MNIFFHSWDSTIRVIVTVLVTYPALIALLLITGKRSLSKVNMFDFIITVAIGSAFASVVMFPGATILDGLIGVTLLLALQFVITWSSFHWDTIEELFKYQPTLLFLDGDFLQDNMSKVHVSEDEVYAEIRQKGFACLSDVHAVVLETNGNVSVLAHNEDIQQTTLVGVHPSGVETP